MKNRFYVISLFLTLSFLIHAESEIKKIVLEHSNMPIGNLSLSDLTENMEYIPLETNDNCIIGRIVFSDISQKYILVSCAHTEQVFLFTRNGKFIKAIGKKGEGPKEYTKVKGLFIDENKNQLVVCDITKIMLFDFKGNLITTYPHSTYNEIFLGFFDDQFLTGIVSGFAQNEIYHLWQKNMKLLNKYIKPISFPGDGKSIMTFPPGITSYTFQGKSHVREVILNDTLYVVDNNNTMTCKYVFDVNRYKITPEFVANPNNFDKMKEFIRINSLAETTQYLFFRYYYHEKAFYGYYDKISNRKFYLESSNGIPNDLNEGPDFWPEKQKNDFWYSFIQSEKLANIDPEDNPVLVLIKVKN